MKHFLISLFVIFIISFFPSPSKSQKFTDIMISQGKVLEVHPEYIVVKIEKGYCKGIRKLKLKDNSSIIPHTSITFLIDGNCLYLLDVVK